MLVLVPVCILYHMVHAPRIFFSVSTYISARSAIKHACREESLNYHACRFYTRHNLCALGGVL